MYYLTLFILFVFSLYEYNKKSSIHDKNRLFLSLYIWLTIMVSIRYGQGTDYFNYYYYYINSYAKEPGFLFLEKICFNNSIPFVIFCGLFAAITMFLFYDFFAKYCKCKIIGLFIFYCLYFLIYPYSAIRQGFACGIFLKFMLPNLLKKETNIFKYILFLCLAISFHYSAIICLLFPFIKKYNLRFIVIICIPILFFTMHYSLASFIPFINKEAYLNRESGTNIFSAITRILTILPLLFFKQEKKYNTYFMLNIYYAGFIVYTLFASSDFSGRLELYSRILLIPLYTNMISQLKSKKIYMYVSCIIFFTIIFFKNIDSFISQGSYSNDINIFNYPYISVFDNPNSIFEYRTVKWENMINEYNNN